MCARAFLGTGSRTRAGGGGSLAASGIVSARSRKKLRGDGKPRDEEVRGQVEEEGPGEREAPDVGRVVEVFGHVGRGVDGPVEGGPARGDVAWGDGLGLSLSCLEKGGGGAGLLTVVDAGMVRTGGGGAVSPLAR